VSLAADEPLTRKEAERIVNGICDRSADGRFRAYCVAIKHAAEEYLSLLAKAAKRKKFQSRAAKQQKKRGGG
jgi:hypothetical protein